MSAPGDVNAGASAAKAAIALSAANSIGARTLIEPDRLVR